MPGINRRAFNISMLKSVGAAALATPGAFSVNRDIQGKIPDRPNIVFICSDQHSYKYAGHMGHPFVKTPHLDKIAREGTVFTNTYCGNPVCVPARSSMMTGMYASDCHSFCNSTVWDGSHPLWTKRLQDAGYDCWATGKLDLNDRFESGMVEVDTHHGHQHNPDITSLFRRPVGYRIKERGNVRGEPRSERHRDSETMRTALDFLNNKAPELDRPWSAYVGFLEPHPQFVALEKYFNLYYPDRVDMPNIPPDHLAQLHLVYQELRHFKRIAEPIDEDRIRRARSAYYGMVTELDEYIGALYDALGKTGQLGNTIFIYTSDHGEMLGEHGLWYKNNLYDAAARVPLVMTGPGIPRGVTIDMPVGHVDLTATILEWAGIRKPAELRGHSLTPLMHGDSGHHPGFVFCETHSEGNCTGSFMVRKGDWKLIAFQWYDDLLFNLREDPDERNNRINDPATREIQSELKAILNDLVDTEAVTLSAFRVQDAMLKDFADRLTEDELVEKFASRLGPGQARVMAKMVKDRFVAG
jgi:choline-sulfatase